MGLWLPLLLEIALGNWGQISATKLWEIGYCTDEMPVNSKVGKHQAAL